MTILARTRTVATRPTRVSPIKPVPFGLGIFATTAAAPCPIALADAAIAAGLASRLPRTNGRGLTAAESFRMNAARNEAWYVAERSAVGTDLEVANRVGLAVEAATALELRALLADRPRVGMPNGETSARGGYCPSADESAWWAAESARLDVERTDAAMEWAACEAGALDAMSLSLIPADLAVTIARECWESRGYDQGYATARSEFGVFDGVID
jgi:hypothetical protein